MTDATALIVKVEGFFIDVLEPIGGIQVDGQQHPITYYELVCDDPHRVEVRLGDPDANGMVCGVRLRLNNSTAYGLAAAVVALAEAGDLAPPNWVAVAAPEVAKDSCLYVFGRPNADTWEPIGPLLDPTLGPSRENYDCEVVSMVRKAGTVVLSIKDRRERALGLILHKRPAMYLGHLIQLAAVENMAALTE